MNVSKKQLFDKLKIRFFYLVSGSPVSSFYTTAKFIDKMYELLKKEENNK